MGLRGISKSQVSRLGEAIDAKVKAFLERPWDGDWPTPWIDATDAKARNNNRIVAVAASIALGVDADARRAVPGLDIGASEAATLWTDFPRTLRRRGLRGVKLVVSDAHEGIKAAVAKVMNPSWQRCRVHFMRKILAHEGQERAARRQGFPCHRFRPTRRRDRQGPVAQGCRPAPPQASKARRLDGCGRGRHPRLPSPPKG